MKKPQLLPIIIFLSLTNFAAAQGYQALNGSPFAGSTAVFNNPAASVGSAYKWDLTLFSAQIKAVTNAAYGTDATPTDGYFSRYLHNNADLSFFNFLFKPDDRHAFNFNLRARTYNHINLLPLNYVDSSVNTFNNFLVINRNTAFLEGSVTHAGWVEADLNYSQLISETDNSRLTGGVTLQIMKSLSGAFSRVSKLSFLESKNATDTTYYLSNGRGAFAYSDNYDNSGGAKDFVNRSRTNLGLSLGIEYLVYNGEKNDGTENNAVNYDWKIGVSLMDIGVHTYKSSAYSLQFADPKTTVTDGNVNDKFASVSDMRALGDSLATIFNSSSYLIDNFAVSNPTRLIVNVDKNLGNHFYVNGELSMNFYSTTSATRLNTRELNLLTVTPRWETRGLGAYLPVQYNTQGKLWIGAAIKLGPLVAGIHNLGIFRKDASLSGGGYLLLSIHPFGSKKAASNLDCR